MRHEFVKIAGDSLVRHLVLARPEVRNAFNAQLIAEFTDALSELASDSHLRVLIVSAEGTTFCAGADFHWMSSLKNASFAENEADAQRLYDLFYALYTFPTPTIARVQGGAYGGGAGLVACCDLAILADDAALSFSEVRIGLIPATIAPFVIRKIGEAKTREYFLTGAPIPAAQAYEIGFANHVVPPEKLDAAVNDYVQLLLKGGPHAVRAAKQLVYDVARLPLEDTKRPTAEWIAAQRITDEGQEGMAAFLEKRKPAWMKG